MERDKLLNVRCTEAEIRMVKALAEDRGLSISDVVRQMILEAFAEQFNQGMSAVRQRKKPRGRWSGR